MAACCPSTLLTLPTGDGVITSGTYDTNTGLLTLSTSVGTNVLLTIPTGATSVVTDNGDETYTHDDGLGNTQDIINNVLNINDETGGDAPTVPVAPATPPTNANLNDTLIELYDDAILFWEYNGTTWTLSGSVDNCCPDTTEALGAGDFADPDNPTAAEVNTYITNNGPFEAGTIFTLVGDGTTTEPDWAWYYDGTSVVRVEDTVLSPFRIQGAVGVDGLATQPTYNNAVTVDDDIHHRGQVLIGGIDGDISDQKLHTLGRYMSETDVDAGMMYRMTSVADPQAEWATYYRQTFPAAINEPFLVQYSIISPTVGGIRGNVLAHAWAMDRLGNVTNNLLFFGVSRAGSQHVQYFYDGINSAEEATIAPALPIQAGATAEWGIGLPAEHFVMDGAGNVTQLSAHPEVALDLLPPPAFMSNPSYNWSYNLFTGTLTGSLTIPGANGQVLLADIDTGDYETLDSNGVVITSGTDNRLAYRSNHAPDLEFESLDSGATRWELWNQRLDATTELGQQEWDAYELIHGTLAVVKEYGQRPSNFVYTAPPLALKTSVGWGQNLQLISVIDATIEQNLNNIDVFTFQQLLDVVFNASIWQSVGGQPNQFQTMTSEANALIQ